MRYEKDYIIQEIKRTAQENGGSPLGMQKFENATGIKKWEWLGIYWSKWSDALLEVGYEPNKFTQPYDEEIVLSKLVSLIREIKKLPSSGELKLKINNDKTFPSTTVFEKLGTQKEKVTKVVEYCRKNEGMQDVLEICLPLLQKEEEKIKATESLESTNFGYVYLIKSGKFHKIGRSNDANRRTYELKIQLPDKLELIHQIKTDDPIGIEEYWHKRFKDKRKNGEWFELTKQDIEIFRRRKFM